MGRIDDMQRHYCYVFIVSHSHQLLCSECKIL